MATIEKTPYQGGKEIRWRVKWRTGGSGPWGGRQFERTATQKRFKALVEANGHTMPLPEQLVEHGFGWLLPPGVAAPAPEPAEEKQTYGLPLPEGPRAERDILESPDEARLFLKAAYQVDPEAADLLLCKLATGLRWGEVTPCRPGRCTSPGAQCRSCRSCGR